MGSGSAGRAALPALARPALASLSIAFVLAATVATAAGAPIQDRQVPSRILFGTVSADWVWEPAPVPATPAVITSPEMIRSTLPRFPSPETLGTGYQGHVMVEATITPTGQVTEPRVVRTPAPGIFDEGVLAAVRQWSFRPATQAGVPVAVTGIFTFHFEAAYRTPNAGNQDAASEPSGRRANALQMGADGLVAPRMISTDLPQYTDSAEQAGIEGDVYIEAVVTKDGTVVEPELIRGLPDDELNRRALEAVTRWRFEPGTKDDQPVDVIALFTVTYRSR